MEVILRNAPNVKRSCYNLVHEEELPACEGEMINLELTGELSPVLA